MSLALPEVKTCCNCFSLETGSKIIGFSLTVLSAAFVVLLVTDEIEHFYRHTFRGGYRYAPSFVYFTDVGVSLHFIFAVYLLQGIYDRKSYYLMAWIILQVATIIVGIFVILIAFGILLGAGRPYNIKSINMEFDRIIIDIIFTIISCYTVLVVNSHRKRMNSQSQARENCES